MPRRYVRLERAQIMSGESANNLAETNARVHVVENDLRNLSAHVETGFKEMRESMRGLADALGGLGRDLAAKPSPIPFKEILTTAATILAVVAYINNFYETQSSKNLAPIVKELEYIKLRVDRNEQSLRPRT